MYLRTVHMYICMYAHMHKHTHAHILGLGNTYFNNIVVLTLYNISITRCNMCNIISGNCSIALQDYIEAQSILNWQILSNKELLPYLILDMHIVLAPFISYILQ